MKRILAVDVGNTFTKYAFMEDGQIKDTRRHPTADMESAAAAIIAACADPIVLSSVVPDATAQLERICAAAGRTLLKLNELKQSIIASPSGELGADLLAAAVAARKLYAPASDLIVIGMGTANTMTAISADGQFKGVHITLGLTPMLEELSRRCALLPKLAEGLDDIAPGFNTEDAVRGGTLLGQVGIVEAWICRAKQRMAQPCVTVATGGWSAAVAKHTAVFDHVDSDLVLKGIFFLYEAAKTAS